MMVNKIYTGMGRGLAGSVFVGSVYYFSVTLVNIFRDKEIVFSPIIGYPLALVRWPQSLYADFIHREYLGIELSFPLTVLSILLVLTWLGLCARKDFRKAS